VRTPPIDSRPSRRRAALGRSRSPCRMRLPPRRAPEANVSFKDVRLTNLSFEGIGATSSWASTTPPGRPQPHSLQYQLTVDNHQFAMGQANRP